MRSTLRIVLPLVLAMGANAVNQFVDRIFLAQFSDEAIQASLPGGILSWLFLCLMVATAGYSGTFVAQYAGAGSRRAAASAFGQGVWLAILSIPLVLLSIPLGHLILDFCGHSQHVLEAEKKYFDILQYGGFFCILSGVIGGYFSGIGRTRTVAAAMVLGNLSNVVLDWMAVFGHWGCPALGIVGAGWATAVAAAISTLTMAAISLFDPYLRGLRYLVALRPRPRLIVDIVRYGVPSGLHQFLDAATFSVFVMATGRLGAIDLAVSNVVFSINHLSFAPLLGLSQGATVLAGRCQGAGNAAGTVRSVWHCLFLAAIYIGMFAALVLGFHDELMDVFRSESSSFDPVEFRSLGRTLMYILLSWAAWDAISMVVGGALKGAGDTKFVMLALFAVSMLLWMPAVFLVMRFSPSITTLWLTMPAYCFICAVVCSVRFIHGRWRRIDLI